MESSQREAERSAEDPLGGTGHLLSRSGNEGDRRIILE